MIVHGLDTPEDREAVEKRIAKIHAQYVLQYVEKLNCPLEQKLKLIDAVAESCRRQAEEERKACRHPDVVKKKASRQEAR